MSGGGTRARREASVPSERGLYVGRWGLGMGGCPQVNKFEYIQGDPYNL